MNAPASEPHAAELESEKTPAPKKKRRRWLWRILLSGLAIILLCTAGLGYLATSSTGQTRLALYVAQYFLPVELSLSGLHVTRTSLRFEALRLNDAAPAAPPLLEAADFHLDYTPRPLDGRYIDHVSLEELRLRYTADAEGRRNWDALLDAFRRDPTIPSAPEGFPLAPWLPKQVALAALHLEAEAPDWTLSLSPLAVESRISALDDFTLYLHGEDMVAHWALPMLDLPQRTVTGGVDAALIRERGSWDLMLDARLPSLAAGELSLRLDHGGPGDETDPASEADVFDLALEMPRMELAAPVLLPLLGPRLPFPLQFATLTLEDTALVGRWQGEQSELETFRLHLESEAVQLGPLEEPWYQGDVGLHAEGRMLWDGETLAPTGNVDWVLKLTDAPLLYLSSSGGFSEATLHLQSQDWGLATLGGLMPPAYAAYLDTLPGFAGVGSIEVTGDWAQSKLQFSADVAPMLQEGSTNYSATIQGELDVDQENEAPWFDGTVALASGQGRLSAQSRLSRDLQLQADLRYQSLHPAPWLLDWLDFAWPEGLGSVITGTARYRYPLGQEGAAHALNFDLQAETFTFNAYDFTETGPLHIQGQASFPGGTPVRGPQLRITQADSFTAQLDNWRTRSEPFQFSAGLSLEADLPALAAYADVSGLWGDITLDGPIVYEGDQVQSTELRLSATDFMWGDWSIPYGSILEINAATVLDWAERPQLRLDGLQATLAQSRAEASQAVLLLPQEDLPFQLRLEQLLLESDLAPIVREGWLESATGTLRITAPELSYTEQGLRGRFDIALEAERMVVPEAIAALGGVVLTGSLAYDGAMNGDGLLHLEHLSVGGIAIGSTDSDVRFVANDLIIDDLVAMLFNGVLAGEAQIGLLQPGLPVEITATVQDLDLERFTVEFEPPDIYLTGLVDGDLAVTFDSTGIVDLRAHLESTENFTLNRDMVEYLLLSEYVGDIGGGRNLERVVQRTVGDALQRTFDSAVLDLGFENGRITGIAVLESRNLSLTFDIVADPEALLEALKIRQQEAM